MAMLTVNGAAVPAPSSMEWTVFDVGSSAARNAMGGAVVDRLGVKRRLDLKWAYMSAADMAALLQRLNQAAFFIVSCPDAQSGEIRQMNCYCSEKSAKLSRMRGEIPEWVDVQMQWTER